MPTINKGTKNVDKSKNEIHRLVYNTKRWRDLRSLFTAQNPLCKKCLQVGLVKSVSDVHHITPISKGDTDLEKVRLGFDYSNLEGLCTEHHKEIHKK